MLGMQRFILWFSLLLLAVPFAQNPGTTSVTARLDVAPSQLLATPIDHNLASYNGEYSGRRLSALRDIDSANVSPVRAQWGVPATNSTHLEVTALVVHGVVFVTLTNATHRL